MRNHGTDVLAARKHKLNNDPFVFYDISVEMHFLIVLRNQFHIRKVTLLNKLARRDVLEVVIVFARRRCLLAKQTGGSNQAACSCRSSNSSSRQPSSPRHTFHDLCSFLFVICHVWLHLEEQHHGVIFVNGVVAVHGPIPLKVAEAGEEGVRLVELEPGDVLPGNLHGRHSVAVGAAVTAVAAAIPAAAPSVAAVSSGILVFSTIMVSARDAAQDLVFLQMSVNGVLPVVTRVDENPVLSTVLRYGEAEFITVCELVVDDPLAVVAIKDEVPCDARRDDARQLIERRMRRRVNAIVGDGGADPKLHTICATGVSPSKDVAGWSGAVFLLQSVLQANFGVAADQTLNLVEIDDDVIALSHADAEAGNFNRVGQQVTVVCDHPERNDGTRTERIS